MNTMSRRTQNLLEELRKAINEAVSQSDAVGNAMAALVEAGVKAPVYIDVALMESATDGTVRGEAIPGSGRGLNLTSLDKAFLKALGIVDDVQLSS